MGQQEHLNFEQPSVVWPCESTLATVDLCLSDEHLNVPYHMAPCVNFVLLVQASACEHQLWLILRVYMDGMTNLDSWVSVNNVLETINLQNVAN